MGIVYNITDLMREYTAKEEGYVFMYVSNANPTLVDVYFDDIVMTHTKGNVIQYNEYYPFGLQTTNSWTRENNTGNNFLGNGGTELNATSNLYDLHYRNYDPTLGRMTQVDPLADKYGSISTYNFAFNDPVYYNDPLGDSPVQDINDSRTADIQRNQANSYRPIGDDDMYGSAFGRAGTLGFDYSSPTPESMWRNHLASIFPGDVYSLDYSIIDYFTNGIQDVDHYIDTEISARWGSIKIASHSYNDPNAGYDWEKTWGAHFAEIRNRDRISDWVPVFGAIESADQALSQGRYGAAGGNFLLAVSDLFLLKSLLQGALKLGAAGFTKTFGIGRSHEYSAAVSRWRSAGILPTGYKHHWLITQKMMNANPALKPLGNQLWNLTSFKSQVTHMRWAHGNAYPSRGLGSIPGWQVFYPMSSTPTWLKAGAASGLGRIED